MRIVGTLPVRYERQLGSVRQLEQRGAVICCMRAQQDTANHTPAATHGITPGTFPSPTRSGARQRASRRNSLPVRQSQAPAGSGLAAGGELPGYVHVHPHLHHQVVH